MRISGIIFECLGWYGTIAIVIAYLLNSFNVISSTSYEYQFLNATGAIGIVIISYIKQAWQPMTLNIIWSLIGALALLGN